MDPAGLTDGINPYVYCHSTPIIGHDTGGMWTVSPILLGPALLADYSKGEEARTYLSEKMVSTEFFRSAFERYLVYKVPGSGGHTADPTWYKPALMFVGANASLERVIHEVAHARLDTDSQARENTLEVADRLVGTSLSDGTHVSEALSLRAAQEAMASYVGGTVAKYGERSEQALRIGAEYLAGQITREEALEDLALQAQFFERAPVGNGAFQAGGGSALAGEGKEVGLVDPLPQDVQVWLDANVIGHAYDSLYDLPAAQQALAVINSTPPPARPE